ncbi:MAG: hypothetical protein JOZ42_03945 [Acetobacteraceae bacterium]|nr:hypothetical protein [Acetobacteraceae bacterium]
MKDAEQSTAERARALAERAIHAQAEGQADEADRLFAEAQALDPDAVAAVLDAHDAALPPDARDQPTADRDAERVRRSEPKADPRDYPGGT